MADFIDLQKRLDDLALRLSGSDRLLVFEACEELRDRQSRLDTIKGALGL